MSDSYSNTNARGDALNQAAAHDTGIYDPNVHDNQIVAMYETEDRARAARDSLIANGVPERIIRITAGEQDGPASDADFERGNSGLWASIKNLFMPHEEAYGYAEGVRRGHAILVVQPDETTDRNRIIELLESTDPVDFDAKLEEWRQAGYSYPGTAGASTIAAGAAGTATGTPTTGVATDTNAMRVTDTTAAGTLRNAPSSSTRENRYASGERPVDLPGGSYEAQNESGLGASADATATPPAASTTLPDDIQRTKATTGTPTIGQDETIKVIEERLQVGKREVVKGAVRVRSYMVERPVEQQVRLHEERVEVERHPVNRPVDVADGALFQERVVEARATSEEAVVGKEARVVEEIGLHRESTDRTETVRDTVRKTEVEIEDEPKAASSTRDPARPAGTTAPTAGATSNDTNAPRR